MNATGGFPEANLLGVGRFRSVYKGAINGVAVKVLNLEVRGVFKKLGIHQNAMH